MNQTSRFSGFSDDELQLVHIVCETFEQTKRRKPVSIEFQLANIPADLKSRMFSELLLIELEAARAHGEFPSAQDYETRFPEYREQIGRVFGQLEDSGSPNMRAGTTDTKDTDEDNTQGPTKAFGQADQATKSLGADSHSDSAFAIEHRHPSAQETQFGDYVLLEKIGAGGMGIVFKAMQSSLKRVVALKMIGAGELAGPEAIDRFYKEAEAAAKLDHPGIVPAFEVGEHDGQHFFSMAYVEGESLSQLLRKGPIKATQAASLLSKIAVAAHAAHEQGVIHRDLKPGNVLITKEGVPRITDFGLAKRMEDDSALTASGQILGTPSFMPPEQARGDIDVGAPADVYALGAILYALLTGRPPFQAASPIETLRQVLDQDPIDPRQLNAAIPRDLATICMKCLDKAASRRYESALSLSDDLERWLNKEPIQARPVGKGERFVRWCQRRPAVAALAASTILVAVIGLGFFTREYVRAEANLVIAIENLNNSERQRERRDANFRKATQAVDQMLTRVGESSLANVPGLSLMRKELLKDAQGFYEEFRSENFNDPDVALESIRATNRVGDIHVLLKEYDPAEQAYQTVIDLCAGLETQFPRVPDFVQEAARASSDLGRLHTDRGNFDAAEAMLKRSLEQHAKLDFIGAKLPNLQLDRAFVHLGLGALYEHTKRETEAEQQYETAISLHASVDDDLAATALYRMRLAECHYKQGGLYLKVGKPAESARAHTMALKMREELVKDMPDVASYRRDLAESHRMTSQILVESGKLEEAQLSMNEAITELDRLVHDFPHFPDYRYRLATCCNLNAIICVRLGDSEGTAKFMTRLVEIYERLHADFPESLNYSDGLGRSYYNLAISKDTSGQREAALVLFEKAVKIRRELSERANNVPQYRNDLGTSCQTLAYILPDERAEEADALLDEAIEIGESLVAGSPENPLYKHKLGQTYRTLGERLTSSAPEKAEARLLQANTIFRELAEQDPGNVKYLRFQVFTLDPLGRLQLSMEREVEAEASIRKVSAILDELVLSGGNVPQFRRERAAGRISLGRLLALVGKHEESSSVLTEAQTELQELNTATPGNHLVESDLARTHDHLARLLTVWAPVDARDQDAALKYAQQAIAISPDQPASRTTLGIVRFQNSEWSEAVGEFDVLGDATDLLFLAMSHAKLGEVEKAKEWYDKAMEWFEEDDRLNDAEMKLYRRQANEILQTVVAKS